MVDFTVIPLDFAKMKTGYVYHDKLGATKIGQEIQRWLKAQNDREKEDNRKENEAREADGKPPVKLHLSTTCCMQLSAAFNVTTHRSRPTARACGGIT